jgi:succinate-semialdehyde dehydrogenase / glutarate-semialdehyde dehydrogenase
MIERADFFSELMVREGGKALADAKGETAYAAEFFRWYAEEAVRNVGMLTTAPAGGNRILVTHQPIGVSVLVTPWNFPAAMATRKLAPALAAGCTTILKPASDTPLTALAIGQVLEEAGVPPGVVNVIPSTRSSSVVKAMLADPRVRKLSFTGSTEVGRVLLAQAAESVVDCSMELGGNAPFIVFADADLDAAVEGAMIAKMRNGGASCVAANRFYVEDTVADAFARRLTDAMAQVRMGPPLDADTELGPMINAAAVDKIDALVSRAVDAGSQVLTGAGRLDGPGSYYPPTVLDHVPDDAAILGEEIFGPVAPIVRFTEVDEAVARANATEYGLVCYVYTRDLAKGLSVAERLETGMVGLNRGVISDPAAPFGGVKHSGIGREGGHEGMLEFLESKYIAVGW